MGLSVDLISQFAKITNDKSKQPKETVAYGTAVKYGGDIYVKLDGSDMLTPVNTTVDVKEASELPDGDIQDGERVTVTIRNHVATATGNASSPAARIDTVKEVDAKVDAQGNTISIMNTNIDLMNADIKVHDSKIKAVESDIGIVKSTVNVQNSKIEAVESDIGIYNSSFKIENDVVTGIKGIDTEWITVEDLEANNAKIGKLEADYAEIDELIASKANIEDLNATNATIEKLKADKADIGDLTAVNANIGNLQADVGYINELMFDTASGKSIQTSFSNSVIAQLGDAQIDSAMIRSVSADKIMSGDIYTNNVHILSEDGKIKIADETILIKDENNTARVQIGKDASDDYSINVWDANGKLMFSKGGITDDAIKQAIIRDDMVKDDANISAGKLDIASLFTEINENGTETIKSNKIYLDDKSQTLNVAFKEMTDAVSSQGTSLEIMQGQISSKIWKQDIDSLVIGARNLLLKTDFGEDPIRSERPEGTEHTEFGVHFYPSVEIEIGVEYTISARMRGNAHVVFYEITNGANKSHFWVSKEELDVNEFKRFSLTFVADANYGQLIDTYICTQWGESNTLVGDWFEIESRSVKLERGNKATDWTPAPEDLEGNMDALSTQYSEINQKLGEIELTVGNNYTNLNERVTNTESTLSIQAEEIASKVSKTDYDALSGRVSNAESTITQHSNEIASKVSQTEYDEKVSQLESSITQTANSITSSVKSLKIGGRNLLPDTDFGNVPQRYERLDTYGTEGGFHFYPTEPIESGMEYTLSLSMRGSANIVFYEINTSGGNVSHAWVRRAELSEEEYRDFYITFTVGTSRVFGNVYICTQWGEDATSVGDWFEIKPCSLKLERGTKATDWSPAPEDMATTDDIDAVNKSIGSAEERITTSESLIQQLSESIATLVRDGNGESLMTQTSTGWTFSTADIQNTVDTTSENLDKLTNQVGDVDAAVGALEQAVNDLGDLNNYIKITTYENKPCIELGKTDSEFKLLITNDSIMFKEGTNTPAYINNESLYINKAVIEEELQQGEFVWKARSNGNLGLIWKEATS